MSRGVSTARSSSESLCYSVTSIASSTREAESDSYSVSSARATPTLSAAPGTAESDSYRVSSAVESLGRSNEHFDQHEQGPSMVERSGRAGASRQIDGTRETFTSTVLGTCAHIPNISRFFFGTVSKARFFSHEAVKIVSLFGT